MLTLELATSGGCTSRQAKLTLDANWRWVHETTGYQNCYTGDSWDGGKCSDPATCAANCGMSIPPFDFILLPRHLASSHVHYPFIKALEGVSKDKYENTYGIKQLQDGVRVSPSFVISSLNS